MADYAEMRSHMVLCQIRPNKVTDAGLIEALREIPREQFVPPARRGVAYVDEDLEVSPGRYLMEPVVFARLLQAAQPGPDDVALDIGCATGYSTAVLGRLAAMVVGLETDPELVAGATERLTALEVDNAVIVEGPLGDGYPAQGPYDVILIGGAVPAVPSEITDQLAEGGRLVAVVAPRPGVGAATLFTRIDGLVSARPAFDAAVPMLPGFDTETGFAF